MPYFTSVSWSMRLIFTSQVCTWFFSRLLSLKCHFSCILHIFHILKSSRYRRALFIMFDRYDIIEITNHDRIVVVMNENVKANYPLSYEQYALTYDFTLDLITQIKSWQSVEKLDAINKMLTEIVEAFDLVNDIMMYSARVNILQRLIRALLTTVYAHLLDKRNSVDVNDDKIIFHAFSFKFESVIELVFSLLDSSNWLFH